MALQKSSERSFSTGELICAYGKVYRGTFGGQVVAIKRTLLDKWDPKSFKEHYALQRLNHPNIVKLLKSQEIDEFRYFILELCDGSLADYITGRYPGPMPDDLDALRQMAAGVEYIHSKNLVHRDINPTNILIGRPAGAVQVKLKISGFGFCEDIEKDGTFLASQIMGTANYLASELLQQFDSDRFIEGRFSDAIDIFSLGCTFYQFLTKGTHPFGSGFNIPSNIMSGNWDLSTLPGDHLAFDLIRKMIQANPNQRPHIDDICKTLSGCTVDFTIVPDKLLGKGAEGIVYPGYFNMKVVAVKRLELLRIKNDEKSQREQTIMSQLNHVNVLKLFHWKDKGEFKYLVLEICSGSLEDFIKDPSKYGTIKEADWLHQMAQGVEHIHSNQLVHRDIKPQNILLSKNWDGRVVLKISDFGFCKPTSIRGSYTQTTGIKGTFSYMAPELLELINMGNDENVKERATIASDVFSLGCVFFKFLTRGVHPFGKLYDISSNILTGHSVNLNSLSNKHFAFEVTKKMIDNNSSCRPTISDVRAPLREILNRDIAVLTNEDKLRGEIGTNASHGRDDPSLELIVAMFCTCLKNLGIGIIWGLVWAALGYFLECSHK